MKSRSIHSVDSVKNSDFNFASIKASAFQASHRAYHFICRRKNSSGRISPGIAAGRKIPLRIILQAQIRTTKMNTITSRYRWGSAAVPHTAAYLHSHIIAACRRVSANRILDLGCGNGALCASLRSAGFDVVGCDPSEDGIAIARRAYPGIPFHKLGVYDSPAALDSNGFDVVVSTEVIEHLFLPRSLPRFAATVLRSGGHLVLTTPYHGYLKNLALSLSGKWDWHFTALRDGGHIKFWSRATLSRLLSEEGFSVSEFIGTGRCPYLWKSMILIARTRKKPNGHAS